MTTQAYPTYQGDEPSWADISLTFAPIGGDILETADFSAISHSSTVEIGEKRGASGGRPMKFTRGSVSHEASVTLYRDGYLRLLRALKDLATERSGQKPVSPVAFNIVIQYTPQGSDDVIQTELRGCRITGTSAEASEGVDPSAVECSLAVLEIVDIVDGEEVPLL